MFRRIRATAIFALLTLGTSTSAFAAFVSFNVTWSGASFGNNASATGLFTFDDTLLPVVGSSGIFNPLPNPAVIAADITVTGTAGGADDGTWGISDLDFFLFETPVALNLGSELIGQPLGGGLVFGGDPLFSTGDFNLTSITSGAPSAIQPFTLITSSGERIRVTSMSPVPIPAAALLFASALGAFGYLGKRKKAV